MNTPICDFVSRYIGSNPCRLHMPGHKGVTLTGAEARDLTEIAGADSLYEASGIIRESEENAGELFGAHTFYSTEGSSHAIRAMLYLVVLFAGQNGQKPVIAAGRNVHRAFLSAAALLDFDILWMLPQTQASYLSCTLTAQQVETYLTRAKDKPTAVYLTAPDYLGNLQNLAPIAAVCHRHGVLLLVDNAHGAYLKFLPQSRHPMDLGADLCCDSAHKTLPALTGAAYLHISKQCPPFFASQAKRALALFGSTSPSYLILQSLDAVNRYLSEDYRAQLAAFLPQMQHCRSRLAEQGFVLYSEEALKLTLCAKPLGYTGTELSAILAQQQIFCEFSDPDFTVMMFSPQNGADAAKRLVEVLCALPRKAPLRAEPPAFSVPQRVFSVRQASALAGEEIDACDSCGKVLLAPNVACPPAVPIVMCGERIDAHAVACFSYYGIRKCYVCDAP